MCIMNYNSSLWSEKMKKGFTLSEVLVVLGIIACLAILTIPSFVNNYKRKVYGAQLKKAVAQYNDAVLSFMADEHVTKKDEISFLNGLYLRTCGDYSSGPCYFLKNYFNTVDICLNADNPQDGCGAFYKTATYKSPKNSSVKGKMPSTMVCALTVDGFTYCLTPDSAVIIDINGKNGPNVVGIDVFPVGYNPENAMLEDWWHGSASKEECGDGDDFNQWGRGCFNGVVEEGWQIPDWNKIFKEAEAKKAGSK